MKTPFYIVVAASLVFLYARGVVPDTPGRQRMGTLSLDDISLFGDEAAPFEIADTRDGGGWGWRDLIFKASARSQSLRLSGEMAGHVIFALLDSPQTALMAAGCHVGNVAAMFKKGLWGADEVIGDTCWSVTCGSHAVLVVKRNVVFMVGISDEKLGMANPEKAMHEARRLAVSLARRIVAKIDRSWLW